jgi:hypothetical protein
LCFFASHPAAFSQKSFLVPKARASKVAA